MPWRLSWSVITQSQARPVQFHGKEDVLMVIPAALVGPEMSRVLMCFALPADSRERISIDVVLGAST